MVVLSTVMLRLQHKNSTGTLRLALKDLNPPEGEITLEKFAKTIGYTILTLLVISLLCALGAYPTKWIVNYLFTPATVLALFGGPLTTVKAFWLNYVCASLFKSSNYTPQTK